VSGPAGVPAVRSALDNDQTHLLSQVASHRSLYPVCASIMNVKHRGHRCVQTIAFIPDVDEHIRSSLACAKKSISNAVLKAASIATKAAMWEEI
jgi:hypothetical protein